MKRIIVAATGASGAIYAVKLLEAVVRFEIEIHLVFSNTAKKVMLYETGESFSEIVERLESGIKMDKLPCRITLHENNNMFSSIASGSFKTEGMIIIPCAIACAGRIASCSGNTLIERAADVCIKERRPLVLAVRETPLNLIHLKNLTALCDAGAVIFPAMPSFYSRPETIDELAENFASRVLASFGLVTENYREWKENEL
ncbi:MAG: UbiX family flavin prenyltransferase [Spirochaetia bacterium]|nr:UbiX family flavin prenyltransferase [Spirochaetia bacterium]